MRHLIAAVAAIAAAGMIASTAVRAEPLFEPGGPAKIGKMCVVNTDENGNASFGYLAGCPNEAVHAAKRTKKAKS
jgi:hypothetical protein